MKVLQFGQGNFLRTFADVYFETLNQEGLDYQVYVATAIPHENLEAFRRQGNRYHVVLRGSQGGQPVEQVLPVTCLQEVIDPFLEPEAFYALAEDPELKLIVSNTTEAGIQFHSQDSFEGFADITFPAKVTKFLYRRFQAGQPGIYLLPVELIDDNAGELARCVEEYITLWGLPQEFRQWNQRENFYCNTLVDRIVSGYPREEETRRYLENLVGQEDSLLAVGEPFGLWVIERKGDIAQYIPQGTHQIDVVLAEDISYYKRRKVRVLNGSHTNLVAAGLWEGCSTVYDCVGAPKLRAFVLDTLEGDCALCVPGCGGHPGIRRQRAGPLCQPLLKPPAHLHSAQLGVQVEGPGFAQLPGLLPAGGENPPEPHQGPGLFGGALPPGPAAGGWLCGGAARPGNPSGGRGAVPHLLPGRGHGGELLGG